MEKTHKWPFNPTDLRDLNLGSNSCINLSHQNYIEELNYFGSPYIRDAMICLLPLRFCLVCLHATDVPCFLIINSFKEYSILQMTDDGGNSNFMGHC